MTTPEPAPDFTVPTPVVQGGDFAKLFVKVDCADLTPEGLDPMWVELRNPGMMPQGVIEDLGASIGEVETDSDGKPVNEAAAAPAIWRVMGKLIRRWHVYDVMSDDEPLPLLDPQPKTPDAVRAAPSVVLKRVMQAMQELQNPQ